MIQLLIDWSIISFHSYEMNVYTFEHETCFVYCVIWLKTRRYRSCLSTTEMVREYEYRKCFDLWF